VTVALTGGACGGKSSLVHELRVRSPWKVPVFLVPEAATKLWRGLPIALADIGTGRLIEAERVLLRGHRTDVQQAWKLASLLDSPASLVVCDRAELDLDAYLGAPTVDRLLAETGSSREDVMSRYQLVLHLVTVADGAPEQFYPTPREERDAWLETAIDTDRACATAWRDHPGYRRIENDMTWDRKLEQALSLIGDALLSPA